MSATRRIRRAVRWTAAGLGLAAGAYGAYVGSAWYRYGHAAPPSGDDVDPLLEQFMPEYEVVERHQVHVMAPAEVTFSAAAEADLQQSMIIRGIFRARELILGAQPDAVSRPKGLLAEMQSLGWRVLAEKPGLEVVVGAVTQPWLANVVFRGLPPDEFRAFQGPDCVKIVWTLRADPVGPAESVFRTETRVATTDPTARRKFRWYWARFSPGIVLIRRVLLEHLKKEAERRAQTRRPGPGNGVAQGSAPHERPRSSRAAAAMAATLADAISDVFTGRFEKVPNPQSGFKNTRSAG